MKSFRSTILQPFQFEPEQKIRVRKELGKSYEKGTKQVHVSAADLLHITEPATHRCSVKKVLLEISKNSQENNCTRVSFLIKLQAGACNFIKKETLAQKFSCEFCETFVNTSSGCFNLNLIFFHFAWINSQFTLKITK